jgi:hypothetical protein
LQATVGRQADAGLNGAGDAQWWGLSALVAQRVTPQLTLAARADYLNNDKNGGGNFGGGFADGINGFGAGDTNAPGYDANVGANRYALSVSATYRLTTNVALRTEYRRDHSTTPSFKNYSDQSYRNSNETVGLQAIVNF